jgi:Domain of unknown function (DUF4328)
VADDVGLSRRLTRATIVFVAASSVLLGVAAFFAMRVAADLRNGIGLSSDPADATSNEIAFSGWAGFGLVAFVVAAVLLLRWVWSASKVLDARGATGRRWRGGWTIGVWFIPFANYILPKLMFNELEKGLQVAYRSEPIGDEWTSATRTELADLWWLLWVSAVIVGQFASFIGGGQDASDDQVATGFMLAAFAMAGFAVAGAVLVFVIRRIETFSQR